MTSIYLIGSLQNPDIPMIAAKLREQGHEVYDEWFAPGPHTDDYWQSYEQNRGHSFLDGLKGWHATHVFQNDMLHFHRARVGILVMPAGKSSHLELGYMIGQGKTGYILLHETPERWDVMYRFAHGVFLTLDDLLEVMARL